MNRLDFLRTMGIVLSIILRKQLSTNVKRHLKIFLGLVILAILLCAVCYIFSFKSIHNRKNVILITLDGLRVDHLSCYGYTRETSPNIDSLAKNGILFEQIITSGCSTKAALTSLFTSLDYRYHKIISHTGILSNQFMTLAEVFQNNGYATAGFVATPMTQKNYNYHQGFEMYEDFMNMDDNDKKKDYISANLVMDKILNWLDNSDQNKPFFLYSHIEEPHPPWFHNSSWLTEKEEDLRFFGKGCTYIPTREELYQISSKKIFNLVAKYDGSIYFADEQIGRLIDKLKSIGVFKNTIIAISADHGFELLDHGTPTHGYCPYDEVVKIPLIIYLGKNLPEPKVIKSQGRIFDIGVTILDLLNISSPNTWEGRNLLSKNHSLPKYAFTFGYGVYSVRTPQYKLVYQHIKTEEGLGHYWKKPSYELYDLKSDPRELNDISHLKPQIVTCLKKEFSSYWNDLSNKKFIQGANEDAKLDKGTIRRLKSLGYIK
jgi:arylsulfatase A-like enzyme